MEEFCKCLNSFITLITWLVWIDWLNIFRRKERERERERERESERERENHIITANNLSTKTVI